MVKEFIISWTALGLVLGFARIGIGSYLVVESAIIISDKIRVSEFFVTSFCPLEQVYQRGLWQSQP